VGDYRLSRLAVADLQSISQYTLETWGLAQAELYLRELEEIIVQLAANPRLGRTCDDIRKGYRRMEHGRHVIFYRVRRSLESRQTNLVEIIRILHARMLPRKHFGEE
jgi:toxin ParE1/3/4